jgi:hypothetical protein
MYLKYSLTSSNMVSVMENIMGIEAHVNKVMELIKDESFLDVTLNVSDTFPFQNQPCDTYIPLD